MRIFCIHCGAANPADVSLCLTCNRVLLPMSPPAPPRRAPQLPGAPLQQVPVPVYSGMYPAAVPPSAGSAASDWGVASTLSPFPYAAGLGLRLVALLVDLTTGGVALSFIFVLLGILQLALSLSDAATGTLAFISLLCWWPLYFIGFWATSGRTLGYQVTGLQLVRQDGGKPHVGDCLVRFAGAICSVGSLFLGYLWMLRDANRQTWHDKMAGTVVVRD